MGFPRIPVITQGELSTGELIAQVKQEIDVRRLVKSRLECLTDFGRYLRGRCLSPSHTDVHPSALYFADGCICTACGWKADAIDLYRLDHPEASVREACQVLLQNADGAKQEEPQKIIRRTTLNPDLALHYHFALAGNPDALARLEAMGFTRQAIRHYRLGWANVLTRLDVEKDAGRFDPADPSLVWRSSTEVFQRQWRFSVPVYVNGQLVQILYRKSDDTLGGAKIQMVAGAGAHLFNADVLATSDMVVFAEGWGDVITLWQCGIPAVTSTNGAGHWNDAWVPLLSNVRRLYVVGDADNAGQQMVARVLKRIPWAREIHLPHVHGSKGDIRDLYLAGWRRPEFDRLLKQADFEAARRVFVKKSW